MPSGMVATRWKTHSGQGSKKQNVLGKEGESHHARTSEKARQVKQATIR